MGLSAKYTDLQFKLWQIAQDWGMTADDGFLPLDEYAAEDTIGGYHENGGEWPMGSVWAVDGMALYAIVRAVRPSAVYEIGVARGCSSTHILAALEANKKGRLISADPAGPGDLVPQDMRERWYFWHERGQDVLAQIGESVEWPDGKTRKLPTPDIIWDDGSHGQQDVADVATFALKHLKKGGFLIIHDAAHFLVGQDIQNGMRQAGIDDFEVYHILPSDCGISVWRKRV